MREERPDPNTSHELRACFQATNRERGADGDVLAVQGRVRRSDGTPWFDFVDVFTVADGRIVRLDTYSR
jgi:ketosteroid isomerase-like protein